MILTVGTESKQWQGERLENKQSGERKKDRGKESLRNYIFQRPGCRMLPLAGIGKLQGNPASEGGEKFS